MHTTALATCLVLGSIQTIGLASSCINMYNIAKVAGNVDVSGSYITTPKNSTMITFLVLSIIGVLFGLMVLSNPNQYATDAWKIIITVLTYIWLAVTLITTILAMTIMSPDGKLEGLPSHFKAGIISGYVLVSLLILIAIFYTFFQHGSYSSI